MAIPGNIHILYFIINDHFNQDVRPWKTIPATGITTMLQLRGIMWNNRVIILQFTT